MELQVDHRVAHGDESQAGVEIAIPAGQSDHEGIGAGNQVGDLEVSCGVGAAAVVRVLEPRFEALKRQYEAKKILSQRLLVPETFELKP